MSKAQARYYDIRNRSNMPFQFIFGLRGCGKSYSGMDYMRELHYEEQHPKFLYLRRTREEADIVASDFGNPYKSLNNDKGYAVKSIGMKGVAGVGAFVENAGEGEEVIGYSVGLSSFAGLRSVDLDEVDYILFDEAIPESHKRLIKDEGHALLNLYETVNRNRELVGRKPVTLYVMGNAIRLNNPILATFNLIHEIQTMLEVGERRRTIPERGIYIELVGNVTIASEKRNTALYKLGVEAFNNEALSSDFVNDDMSAVKPSVDMRQYKPFLAFGDYGIYYNPSADIFHVCDAKGTFRSRLKASEGQRFRLAFAPRYRILRAMDLITFKSYETMLFMDELLGYEVT